MGHCQGDRLCRRQPPEVYIYKPEENVTWSVGQRISFKGIAFADGDSEPLSQSGLYWKTRLAHCPFGACHLHPLQIFPGSWEGELTAPEHDYPSYLEIALTATDPRGLSATTTLKLNARPVELQVRSEPPGVRLTAGAETAAAPFALTVIEGAHVSLSAPPTAESGGVTGTFAGWSDGGARSHTVQANASTGIRRPLFVPEHLGRTPDDAARDATATAHRPAQAPTEGDGLTDGPLRLLRQGRQRWLSLQARQSAVPALSLAAHLPAPEARQACFPYLRHLSRRELGLADLSLESAAPATAARQAPALALKAGPAGPAGSPQRLCAAANRIATRL